MTTSDDRSGMEQFLTEPGRTKEATWLEVFARQKASGMTQVEFCRQNGIKKTSFAWWKGQLLGRSGTRGQAAKEGKQ